MHGQGMLSLSCLVSSPGFCTCCLPLPATALCSQGRDGTWQEDMAEITVSSAAQAVPPPATTVASPSKKPPRACPCREHASRCLWSPAPAILQAWLQHLAGI